MKVSTEKPPISGLLYNCALNCALPSIFEISRTFSQSNLPQLPQFQAYVDLKNCFQQWYQLRELSWDAYNAIIARHTHSENELLFAPVIRQFIAKQAARNIEIEADPRGHAHHGYIETLRDIVDDPLARFDDDQIIAAGLGSIIERARADELAQLEALEREDWSHAQKIEFYRRVLKNDQLNNGAGRYYALTSADANKLFYRPFGFHMHVLQFRRMDQDTEVYAPTGQEPHNSIHVYLKNNHYELQEHISSHELSLACRYNHLVLDTAFSNIGESKVGTNQQLAKILTYVNPQALREHPALPHVPYSELSRENYYLEYFRIANEHKLHSVTHDGRLTFAVILLTLMENSSSTKGSPASLTLDELKECQDQKKIEKIIDETFAQCASLEQPASNHYPNPHGFWNSKLVRGASLALIVDVVANVIAAFVKALSAFLFSPPGIILCAIIAAVSMLVLYQKIREQSAPHL